MAQGFGDDFIWGASTSAHQVEGGNLNDWTVWEKRNAQKLAENAGHEPGAKDPSNYISGAAADHYHRYEADLGLAKEIGLSAYRFSIEWSRVEPEPGQFDQAAIDHYRGVIKAARDQGLEPFVTLWHWTLPTWVASRGGWSRRRTIAAFERFVGEIVKQLGSDINYWLTINEPEVYCENVYQLGRWLAQRHNSFVYFWALRNLALAHRKAYRQIKHQFPQAQVGLCKHNVYFEPYRNKWYNRLIVFYGDKLWNQQLLNWTKHQLDFIGLNYYFHARVNLWKSQTEDRYVSDMGWELYPKGLYVLLRDLAKRYKKPIYITEHGLADAADKLRGWYITESLKQVQRAMAAGADVRGYFHWSLIDNYEFGSGFWPRFGLIAVDYQTQQRTVRPSAQVLKQIIESGL